ncbi:MAG: hypothetical protein AAF478_01125 [Pseudomonadota bacterium]
MRIIIMIAALLLPMWNTQAETSSGPAILTLSGDISNTNRAGTDEFNDAFFASHDVEFERAYTFDLSALEALGVHKVTVSHEDWPKAFTFEGPLLSDLLKTVGADGDTLIIRALDGYAPEIPSADAAKYPVILALKRDGNYLGLGGRGPVWLIYPRNDFPELKSEDDSKFVWSAYHIEVKNEQ